MDRDVEKWQFEGFSSPNFTSVPDEFFDVLAPRLSGSEVKVLLYIIRRTFGFKKIVTIFHSAKCSTEL